LFEKIVVPRKPVSVDVDGVKVTYKAAGDGFLMAILALE
jgi:hypothetical protein